MKTWLPIFFLSAMSLNAWASVEIVDAPSEAPAPVPMPGAQLVGTSPSELSCLFESVGFISHANAEKTASAISRALANISFPSGTFNRISLFHFMSQVIAESDHLRTDEEYGHLAFDKKGWAMIQVTGANNFIDSVSCMDRFANGRGSAVLAGPTETVGNQAYDRFSSALMSLCYWRATITMNPRYREISQTATTLASRELTQIVNAGAIGLPVTNGERNLRERAESFSRIVAADASTKCRP